MVQNWAVFIKLRGKKKKKSKLGKKVSAKTKNFF